MTVTEVPVAEHPAAPDFLPRELVAERLLRTAAKHSHDPDTEIDWDAPPVPGAYYCPPELCSLYGTALWERMSDEQRIELTKHEVASIATTGIWFETILMEMLLRNIYRKDPTSQHVRHTYMEVAEECRHSMMFARMVKTWNAEGYGPRPLARLLGWVGKTLPPPALTFGGTLYVEEITDSLQRLSIADDTVQPLARAVSKIHVVEEARHIQFARDEIKRRAARYNRRERAEARMVLALVAYVTTEALIHPGVYQAVGLDAREAVAAAKANPQWRATKRRATAKVRQVLGEAGLIAGPWTFLWRKAGLID